MRGNQLRFVQTAMMDVHGCHCQVPGTLFTALKSYLGKIEGLAACMNLDDTVWDFFPHHKTLCFPFWLYFELGLLLGLPAPVINSDGFGKQSS